MLILGLFLGAFLLRLLVVWDARPGFDTFGHMYFARELKDQGGGPFSEIVPRCGSDYKYQQPFFWHWLLGWFPMSFLIRRQKLINPAIDAGFSILFFEVGIQLGLPVDQSLQAWLLYLFTPMWFSRTGIGPRINSLTPRLISEVLGSVFFLVTIPPFPLPLSLRLILGGVTSGLVFSVSKFGVQVMLFLAPLASLFARDLTPLIGLGLGMIGILLWSRGRFWGAIRFQFRHLRGYFWANLAGQTAISDRNSFAKVFATLTAGTWKERIAGFGKQALRFNTFTAILVKMPIILWVFWRLITASQPSSIPGPVMILSAPLLAAALVCLVVSLPPFLFLGEAERYLNHVSFSVVVPAVLLAGPPGESGWIPYLIAYGALFTVLEVVFLPRLDPALKRSSNQEEILEYLKKLPKPVNIAGWPYHVIGGWRILLETDHTFLYPPIWNDQQMAEFSEYNDLYPFFSLDRFPEMAEKYHIELAIFDAEKLAVKPGWVPPPPWKPLALGQPDYRVYFRDGS